MIRIENVSKVYSTRLGPHTVLDNVNFELDRGRNIGISDGWVAQLAGQWTENPRVGGFDSAPAIIFVNGERVNLCHYPVAAAQMDARTRDKKIAPNRANRR